jgi:dienelactone hydrolase
VIDFTYDKYNNNNIDFVQGYINKGKNYRESIIKYPSLYTHAKKGTELNEIYLFEPKKKAVGLVIILHGLGTKNISYILKMGRYFSNFGVRALVPILPDNYTRTSNGSMSGKKYFSDSVGSILNTWEHAVVDILSLIDFLKMNNLWHENNCMIGYCLGGMVSVIVNSINTSIKHNFIIASGGNIADLLWNSPILQYARRDFLNNKDDPYLLNDKDYLIKIFQDTLKHPDNFKSVGDILKSEIHPLLKVDPALYAKFLPREKVTFLEAAFDFALPKSSRKILWENLGKPKRIVLPIDHITWLAFHRLISNIILNEMKFEGVGYQFLNLRYIAKFQSPKNN